MSGKREEYSAIRTNNKLAEIYRIRSEIHSCTNKLRNNTINVEVAAHLKIIKSEEDEIDDADDTNGTMKPINKSLGLLHHANSTA